MKLKTQAQLIEEQLPELEAEFGKENPFVKGLREQLSGLKSQSERKARNVEKYSVATLGQKT